MQTPLRSKRPEPGWNLKPRRISGYRGSHLGLLGLSPFGKKSGKGQTSSGDNSKMNIRRYQMNDRTAVLDLWERCGLVDVVSRPVAEADIDRKLQVQPELFLVGTLGRELVATGMAGHDGHRGHLYYVAVSPSHQRRNFGRQMISHVEDLLRHRSCRRLTLYVSCDNLDVTGFYKRLGFNRNDVVSMGKDINPDASSRLQDD